MLHVFADTSYWVALVHTDDHFHDRSNRWAYRIRGRIITTQAVMIETVNALSKPQWRRLVIPLINHLYSRTDVKVLKLNDDI